MSAENPKSDSGNVWIVLPFALAVLGTVVMLFTNSANMLKASLILALWAAAAGIILTSRLRRDRDEAQRALADHDRRHRAELDAAKARGEADRAALALARNDEDIPVGVDVEVLREIQAELAALRAQLEEMAGRQFEYEPAALRAEARRIAELGAAEPSPKPAREPEAETVVPEEPAAPERPEEPTPAPAPAPAPHHKHEAPSQPGPSAADTTKLPPVRDAAEPKRRQARPAGAPTSEAIAGRLGAQPSARSAQHNPLSQLISERRAEESAGAERAEHSARTAPTAPTAPTEPARHAEPTANPVDRPVDKPAEKPAAQPTPERRGGRRRRDERGSGALSVAELLARSKGAGEDRG